MFPPMALVKCCHSSGSRPTDGLYDAARVTALAQSNLPTTRSSGLVRMSHDEIDDRCMLQDQPAREEESQFKGHRRVRCRIDHHNDEWRPAIWPRTAQLPRGSDRSTVDLRLPLHACRDDGNCTKTCEMFATQRRKMRATQAPHSILLGRRGPLSHRWHDIRPEKQIHWSLVVKLSLANRFCSHLEDPTVCSF